MNDRPEAAIGDSGQTTRDAHLGQRGVPPPPVPGLSRVVAGARISAGIGLVRRIVWDRRRTLRLKRVVSLKHDEPMEQPTYQI